MSTPTQIITKPHGTTYYTMTKALLLLGEVTGKMIEKLEEERKEMRPTNFSGIDKLTGKNDMLMIMTKELESEFKKYIVP